MVAFALKVPFSIPCFKYLFQNNKYGNNNCIEVITLVFPCTLRIVGCENMMLKSSGLYHFEGCINYLCLETYCLIGHLPSHSQSSILMSSKQQWEQH